MSDVIVEQLQSLLPPVSYDPAGKVVLAQLSAEATVLGNALDKLEAVEGAIFPASAGEYIADWERIYEITPPANASQEDRIQAVIAAMGDLGGQSIPYFVRLASLFGVDINVETFRLPVVGPMNAGDNVYSGDWPYTWRVNSPLSAFVSELLEARVTERRPANTDVLFGYGLEVVNLISAAVDSHFNTIHYVMPSDVRSIND